MEELERCREGLEVVDGWKVIFTTSTAWVGVRLLVKHVDKDGNSAVAVLQTFPTMRAAERYVIDRGYVKEINEEPIDTGYEPFYDYRDGVKH